MMESIMATMRVGRGVLARLRCWGKLWRREATPLLQLVGPMASGRVTNRFGLRQLGVGHGSVWHYKPQNPPTSIASTLLNLLDIAPSAPSEIPEFPKSRRPHWQS